MGDFLRRRIEGVLDKAATQVILWLAVLGTPLLVGTILDIGWVATAIALLLVCQIVLVVLLLSIKRRLSPEPTMKEPLVQDGTSAALYLTDRFGFRRSVPDAETATYLTEILGYEGEDIPAVDAVSLRPSGAIVRSVRRWKPIHTKESHISFEASRSLRLLKKGVRSDERQSVLSFHVRNDSDVPMRIDSAQLTCEPDAPLKAADISPRNVPTTLGLMTCRLLFEGETAVKDLTAGSQSSLELLLVRPLSVDEAETLKTVHLGYIAFNGMFREHPVTFHMQV
jgi:hypothetical protein